MHRSVLLDEAVEALAVDPQGNYIDGTFGRGGHSRALLGRLSPQARVMGVDKDPQAVASGRQLEAEDSRFVMARGSFADFEQLAAAAGWPDAVQGVLLDLGVSSPQLDEAERGFSFMRDGPLDMRMDSAAGMTAAEWLNTTAEKEMVRVFREYGEERFSGRIASAIVRRRQEAPLERTLEFASLIESSVPRRDKGKHPATRVFQAIRIAVNNELGDLRRGLEAALRSLAPGGRLVVISFHSLEDRLVKQFLREHSRGEVLPRNVPIQGEVAAGPLRLLGKKKAGAAELEQNPRARSAMMRIAERRQPEPSA